MATINYLFQLTDYRRSAVIAAYECDSITNANFRTQTLNWLSEHDLLEPFNIEEVGRKNGKSRMVTWYALTDHGREIVKQSRAPKKLVQVSDEEWQKAIEARPK